MLQLLQSQRKVPGRGRDGCSGMNKPAGRGASGPCERQKIMRSGVVIIMQLMDAMKYDVLSWKSGGVIYKDREDSQRNYKFGCWRSVIPATRHHCRSSSSQCPRPSLCQLLHQ